VSPKNADAADLATVDFDRLVDRRGTDSIKWAQWGPQVLPLWVADMDFEAPPVVLDALRRRVDHGVLGYGMVRESLAAAIVAHHRDRHGWAIDPDWIVFLPTVVPALGLACRAFSQPGDAVMVITPAYPPFLNTPRKQGRETITVPSAVEQGRWTLPLQQMEDAVTERTRVLLFCHPHNPFGRAWSPDEVRSVVDFCHRHDLILCSDEIHSELRLDQVPHLPAAAVEGGADITVTVTSPSKAYNLAGLEFAYAVIADADLRRRFCSAGEGLFEYDSPGVLGAAACEAAYRDGAPWLEQLLDYLCGNRDLVERFVAERLPSARMTHVEATYLAWLDARDTGTSDPAGRCLAAGVGLSDGADFGAAGFLRLNFGCRRALLEEALARMATALA
jgi:cysteine-S-conjugate beta-lyase